MNLKNIKIIFIDIDGTLVNSKKEITEETRKSIDKVVKKGIKVVITSGRDLVHTIEKSKLSKSSSIVIATGGSKIYDYEKDITIFEDCFTYQKVLDIWNYCKTKEIGLILKSNTEVYYNNYSLVTKGLKYRLVNNINEITDKHITQFLLMSNEYEKIETAHSYAKSNNMFITSCSLSYLENSNSNHFAIDINNTDLSKGTAIKRVLNHLNIDKENTMCFGDYYNDITMFDECNIKVAMGNSVEEIKERADFITKSNDEDGIAHFLNKYL